ncbi:MAG: hypothetical protein AAB908_00755 [Patescibacteria group bacterium]
MFLKRSTGKVVLVADIDDMSVGVSIVRLIPGEPAVVISKKRETLPLEERTKEHSAAAISQLLEKNAGDVLKSYAGTAAKAAPKPPVAVYAILHAPWTRFRTAETEELYDTPRVVRKDAIATLAKKALEATSDFDRGNILETGVMHVYLNGYATGTPIGKRAVCAGVIAFESEAQPDIKKSITDVLSRILPGRTPIIRSSTSALLAVLGEHMPDIQRFLVIDVGSSVTSCAAVLKEAQTRTEVVQEGLTTILARVAGAGLPEETLTQLRMLATDTCSTDACKALKDSLARAEPDLAKVFGEAFAKLAAERRLPNAAMLSAPAEFSPWLQGFFSRIDFSQFTATLQPFTVEPLTAEHLRDVVTWQEGLPDTALGVAAGYVNILEQDS